MAQMANSSNTDSTEKTLRSKSSIGHHSLRFLCWGVIITLTLFGASNLWLASAWGTNSIETELNKRTGQDWGIGSMSWSPWNGISLYDTEMLQPEKLRDQTNQPFMVVKKMRIRPYWRQLARGQVYPRNIEINSPDLTLSLEMFAAIASNTSIPKAQKPTPAKPASPETKPSTTEPNTPTTPKKNPITPTPKSPLAEKKTTPHKLPVHLKITNARCRLISASKQLDIIDINNLNYDHILLGENTEGIINIGSIRLVGLDEQNDIQQKIVWERPYLKIEEQIIDLGGVQARTIAQLGIGKNRIGRLPFLIDLSVDRQKIDGAQWLKHIAMEVKADSVAAQITLNGLLHQPKSWRANGALSANQFLIREQHGNHNVAFEELFLPIVFRQGTLRWSGARLISEDLSIMSNGNMSVRDGHLSVTRIVASPEAAAYLSRGIHGSHLFGRPGRWWYDLDTPDRVMRDLVISGPLLEPEIDAGAKFANLPLITVVTTLYEFIRIEMKEAGKELKALPIPDHSHKTETKP